MVVYENEVIVCTKYSPLDLLQFKEVEKPTLRTMKY
jgi:hypothetical protein